MQVSKLSVRYDGKFMKRLVFIFFTLFFSGSAFSESLSENQNWKTSFEKNSVVGVIVICKLNAVSCTTNDKNRAVTPFIPASTFKIPNALIALETGVINDSHQIFKWDGKPRGLKQWENDFTLRGAMQGSVVPVFQQFARAIGDENMSKYLRKFDYGNMDSGGGIDHFWLDGKLKISAIQQIEFLKMLYAGKLPASQANQLIVKDALLSELTSNYLIRSKTGYSLGAPGYGDHSKPGIGWWVGWIEKGVDVYFFAANIDVVSDGQLPARKAVPTEIMQAEGILIGG